jgi:hypothetical protein
MTDNGKWIKKTVFNWILLFYFGIYFFFGFILGWEGKADYVKANYVSFLIILFGILFTPLSYILCSSIYPGIREVWVKK